MVTAVSAGLFFISADTAFRNRKDIVELLRLYWQAFKLGRQIQKELRLGRQAASMQPPWQRRMNADPKNHGR